MASNGPLPAHLTLLTSLPSQAAGAKVRFLGCVDSYNRQTGSLRLSHAFPSSPNDSHVQAVVDVNVILENMKRKDLETGTWVNLIGYVQKRKKTAADSGVSVDVQAVALWGAGSVKLGKYEATVAERLAVEKD